MKHIVNYLCKNIQENMCHHARKLLENTHTVESSRFVSDFIR